MNSVERSLLIYKSVSGGIFPVAHFQRDLSSPKPSTVRRRLPTFASLLSLLLRVEKHLAQRGVLLILRGLNRCKNTEKRMNEPEVS